MKLFRKEIALSLIEREIEVAKKAFTLGVPACIPFEMVKCGDSYGIVYELINSTTLLEMLAKNPSDSNLIRKYAGLGRSSNEIPYCAKGGRAALFKYRLLAVTERMKDVFFTEAESGRYRASFWPWRTGRPSSMGTATPGMSWCMGMNSSTSI